MKMKSLCRKPVLVGLIICFVAWCVTLGVYIIDVDCWFERDVVGINATGANIHLWTTPTVDRLSIPWLLTIVTNRVPPSMHITVAVDPGSDVVAIKILTVTAVYADGYSHDIPLSSDPNSGSSGFVSVVGSELREQSEKSHPSTSRSHITVAKDMPLAVMHGDEVLMQVAALLLDENGQQQEIQFSGHLHRLRRTIWTTNLRQMLWGH